MRNDGLEELLNSISLQKYKSIPKPEVTVCIADNDTYQKSAHKLVEKLKKKYRWRVKYIHEKRRGIPFARNASIKLADPKSDYIIFVDDDEIVPQDWLENLVLEINKYKTDIVTGHVKPIYGKSAPDWVKDNGFFNRPTYKDGSKPNAIATNNTIVRAEIFLKNGFLFDENYAYTGSTDTELFWRLKKNGYTAAWSNKCTVYERICKNRENFRWIAKRTIRGTSMYAYLSLKYSENWIITLFERAVKGIIYISIGLFRCGVAKITRKKDYYKEKALFWGGYGTIIGIMGYTIEEYRPFRNKMYATSFKLTKLSELNKTKIKQ